MATKRKQLETKPVTKRYKQEEENEDTTDITNVPITTYMFDCALCMQEQSVTVEDYNSHRHYTEGFCSKECMVGFHTTIGKRAIQRIDDEIARLMLQKQQIVRAVDAVVSSDSVVDESKMGELQLERYQDARDGHSLYWGRCSPRYAPLEPDVCEFTPPVLALFGEFMH